MRVKIIERGFVYYSSEVGMDYDGNLGVNYKKRNKSKPLKENEGKY